MADVATRARRRLEKLRALLWAGEGPDEVSRGSGEGAGDAAVEAGARTGRASLGAREAARDSLAMGGASRGSGEGTGDVSRGSGDAAVEAGARTGRALLGAGDGAGGASLGAGEGTDDALLGVGKGAGDASVEARARPGGASLGAREGARDPSPGPRARTGSASREPGAGSGRAPRGPVEARRRAKALARRRASALARGRVATLRASSGGLVRRRVDRLRASSWPIAQAVCAATFAWWLARQIPHHPQPFFAPIAAVVAMGATPGTRGRQGLELILGVVLGIGVAALVVAVAGTGTWQLGLAAAVSLVAATLLSSRPMIVNQAAASAVLLIALHRPGAAPGRLLDALVGGGVAILIAQLLLPIDPVAVLRTAARRTRDDLAGPIHELACALRDRDEERTRRLLATLSALDGRALDDALTMARDVVRRAPRRRRERRNVEAYASVAQELHTAAADARALASGALRLLREPTPPPEVAADAAAEVAASLRAGDAESAAVHADRARTQARRALEEAPSLGMNVYAHAVDALGGHAARAAAAADDVSRRTRRGLVSVYRRRPHVTPRMLRRRR